MKLIEGLEGKKVTIPFSGFRSRELFNAAGKAVYLHEERSGITLSLGRKMHLDQSWRPKDVVVVSKSNTRQRLHLGPRAFGNKTESIHMPQWLRELRKKDKTSKELHNKKPLSHHI